MAHGNPEVLTPELFDSEDVLFILEHRPLVVVADAAVEAHHPDALQGYRNYFAVLDEHVKAVPQSPDARGGATRAPLTYTRKQLGAQLENLAALVPTAKGQPGYGVFYHSLTVDPLPAFDFRPPPFAWTDVQGPALICVQTAMSGPDVAAKASRAEARYLAQVSPPGFFHSAAAFDDQDLAVPHPWVGSKGVLEFRPALQPAARVHYRNLGKVAAAENRPVGRPKTNPR